MTHSIRINVMDTETTGFPPNASVVEFAYTRLEVFFEDPEKTKAIDIKVGDTTAYLMKPEHPIGLEAMAIHHIQEKHVAEMRPCREVLDRLKTEPCDYWAAHNAAFDRKFFDAEGLRWICTMKVAQTLYPDAPSYKNQVLRYWLNLDNHMDVSRTDPAHRAGPDTYVTAYLLAKMIASRKMDLDTMHLITMSKIAQGNITFGKHRGTLWKDLPLDYLAWLAKNGQSEDVVESAKHYMKLRCNG